MGKSYYSQPLFTFVIKERNWDLFSGDNPVNTGTGRWTVLFRPFSRQVRVEGFCI